MAASPWQPYHEPLRTTLLRTITIALVVGFVVSRWWGGLARWPVLTLLTLWMGGLVFIGVELVAQLALQLRGRPSFYNGRG